MRRSDDVPYPALRAHIGLLGEVSIGRTGIRAFIRGETVARGRVGASIFDPPPALRAKIRRLSEGAGRAAILAHMIKGSVSAEFAEAGYVVIADVLSCDE